jgi:hypothetical protein
VQNINLAHLYDHDSANLHELQQPCTWEEIEQAIKHAPPGRSPGPDGFTNEFYKFYKQDLKADLLELLQCVYNMDIQLAGLNLATVALLPKCDNATHIKDFKTVSLQHSIPKLIAKVLANRLQPRIKKLVDEMQSGFLKDRSIVENFAAAIEMIQCGNRL